MTREKLMKWSFQTVNPKLGSVSRVRLLVLVSPSSLKADEMLSRCAVAIRAQASKMRSERLARRLAKKIKE